jgi:hypothetical protein
MRIKRFPTCVLIILVVILPFSILFLSIGSYKAGMADPGKIAAPVDLTPSSYPFMLTLTRNLTFFADKLEVADIDNDDDMEFITGYDKDLWVYEVNDSLSFEPQYHDYFSGLQWGIQDVKAADTDTDGVLEITACAGGPSDTDGMGHVRIFDYYGTYQMVRSQINIGEYTETAAVGDVDNDGINELVVGVSWYGRKLQIYENNGTNNFVLDWEADINSDVRGVAIADLDNDGINEIVAALGQWSGYAVRIYKYVTGSYVNVWSFNAPQVVFKFVEIADLDSDGKKEIIIGSIETNSSLRVIKHVSGNQYQQVWVTAMPASVRDILVSDLDRDLAMELVVAFQNGVFVYRYEGGAYQQIANLSLVDVRGLGAGDLDGDDCPEILVGVGGSTPHLLIYNACNDTDCDGLTDYQEGAIYFTNGSCADSDADGMPDGWEARSGLNPLLNDSENDGDGDGISNLLEFFIGTEPRDNDTDHDGLPDYVEYVVYSTDPTHFDTDRDGISDFTEIFIFSTDPKQNDTDHDGLEDNLEVNVYHTNPLTNDTDTDLLSDLLEIQIASNPFALDTDGDGLGDYEEFFVYLTNLRNIDSDSDGVTDSEEIIQGINPLSNDSDFDGLMDGWEIHYGLNPLVNDSFIDNDNDTLINLVEFQHFCNPLSNDTDGDGFSDEIEVFTIHTNPTMNDTDHDGITDLMEVQVFLTDPLNCDTDGDNLRDGLEILLYFTSPLLIDSDGDLVNDYLEVLVYSTNPLLPDSDGDNLDDGMECFFFSTDPSSNDSDSDGLLDFSELIIFLTDPLRNDTDNDGLIDSWEVSYGLDPLVDDHTLDPDLDGLTNEQEYASQTNPMLLDSDQDGFSDKEEITANSDPLDPESIPEGGSEPPGETPLAIPGYPFLFLLLPISICIIVLRVLKAMRNKKGETQC